VQEILKIPPAEQVKAEIERRRQEIIQLKRILKIARDGAPVLELSRAARQGTGEATVNA